MGHSLRKWDKENMGTTEQQMAILDRHAKEPALCPVCGPAAPPLRHLGPWRFRCVACRVVWAGLPAFEAKQLDGDPPWYKRGSWRDYEKKRTPKGRG